MKPIKRMHIVDKLPSGKFKVHGFDGEFTTSELEKLQKLIAAENVGFTLWVL